MALRAVATMAMGARASPKGITRHFSTISPNLFNPPPSIAATGNGEGTPVREQAPPSTNLFVSGLNERTTVEKLRESFSQFGRVIDGIRFCKICHHRGGRERKRGNGWQEYARPRPERSSPQNNTYNS